MYEVGRITVPVMLRIRGCISLRFNISLRQKFMPSLIQHKKRISVSVRRRKSATQVYTTQTIPLRTDDVFGHTNNETS